MVNMEQNSKNQSNQSNQSKQSKQSPRKEVNWDKVIRNLTPFIMVLIVSIINVGYGPNFEKYYLNSVNKWMNQLMSIVSGFYRDSLGEMAVYLHIILLVVIGIVLLLKLFKGGFLKSILQILQYVALVYTAFMILWGFHYNRDGIQERMNFEVQYYDENALYELALDLTDEANALRNEQLEDENGVMRTNGNYRSVFARASEGYDEIAQTYAFLGGFYGKPKPIKASEWLSYTGITGIYFPFTAEANVNINVPDLLLPATTLHEMAHQRGVAPEDEANFIAYVTSCVHPDADFRYSGTVLALIHTVAALESSNPELSSQIRSHYSEGLKRDLTAYNQFWKPYEGSINEIATDVNDAYLKVNNQSDGVKSYGMMVDLLLAYRNR